MIKVAKWIIEHKYNCSGDFRETRALIGRVLHHILL